MSRPAGDLSIIPESGNFAIPSGLSSRGEGFEQQTFLGASIRSVSMNAGYGDTTTTVNVELVNDEYNRSDRTPAGLGDDVYHNGQYDRFSPPPVGSPVFFKIGKKRASVNNAYLKLFDDIYGGNSSQNAVGQFHLCFGGILQSYVQNRGPGGNPLYSAQIVDPREILSNVVLILNNYAGTTFNNKNMFNLYGFLEFNPSPSLKQQLNTEYSYKDEFRKIVRGDGSYYFDGLDIRSKFPDTFSGFNINIPGVTVDSNALFPARLPITGTGYARRGTHGMPYYRIRQALLALLGIEGQLPQEYIDAGFGGFINFRGFNYIVDLGGLPANIDNYYYFDFDQINLLDFCLEMCDITSRDLFVSLLPIINHPACQRFYNWNQDKMSSNQQDKIIAGIIRVDSIDKSFQPQYGAIKNYIDNLSNLGIYVENQDVGFELSNVTTDKFITGAQEVDMYYFSNNADRDELEIRKQRAGISSKASQLLSSQWKLETSLKQQILPYYGLLGNKAVTIPKGFGSYQQILLDTSGLNAIGVGNYYVATELELRAALVSYERWSEFLLMYNDTYMESTEDDDSLEANLLTNTISPTDGLELLELSRNYAVTVPRSVWPSENPSYGADGLPVSPCNPPYGYPLYYKRATKLGVYGAGLSEISTQINSIITDLATLNGATGNNFSIVVDEKIKELNDTTNDTSFARQYKRFILSKIRQLGSYENAIGFLKEQENNLVPLIYFQSKLQKKTKQNSLRVYNFLRSIADECLGKKFLVKIPRKVNLKYKKTITIKHGNDVNEYDEGPFGFPPRAINANPGYEFSDTFQALVRQQANNISDTDSSIQYFLDADPRKNVNFPGALEVNFNPIVDDFEFNYLPEKQGGYVEFDLLQNVSRNRPLGITQGLVPQDLSNFINENSRLAPYVRFDNSQFLSFDTLNQSDFTQQVVAGGQFIPDLSDALDNIDVSNNRFNSFPNSVNTANLTKTVGFVKCDLSDKFYMAPKSTYINVEVHGKEIIDIGEYTVPKKIFDCSIEPTGGYRNSFRLYKRHYIPRPTGSNSVIVLDFNRVGGKIKYTNEDLDTNHVYAIITLPSKITPTVDARFMDASFQEINTAHIKHYLTMDTVKLPEFEEPRVDNIGPTNLVNRFKSLIDPDNFSAALDARKKAMSSLTFGLPQKISVTSPSPVYPNLVVLPLMSKERCYGPWVSSQIDRQASVYNNIAGRIEFVKDENLAPWNYNGYDLMNNAGILQAQFSNSLLLQSERGGFVVPDAPSGIFLGKALANAGPLVTNISVDISEAGVKTTYKLDLYTPSFGKLQKQKEFQITNMSRERQKLKDEKNALIRKGIGKNQTNGNFQIVYDKMNNTLKSLTTQSYSTQGQNNSNYYISQIKSDKSLRQSVADSNMFGDNPIVTETRQTFNTSMIDASKLNDIAENLEQDQINEFYFNSASTNIADERIASSMEPYHPNMPYMEQELSQDVINYLYNDGLDV